jgi:hypothetical protein
MKSIGRLYADTLKLKHPTFPLFEWGWSQETEEPYRESAACLVFWVPFIPRGYAVGIWGNPVHEDVALRKAIKKFDDAPEAKTIRDWSKVGENEDF